MRPYRLKFDASSPFYLIDNLKSFQTIKSTDKIFPQFINRGIQTNPSQKDRHNIVVPKIQIILSHSRRKSFAIIKSNYIRLPAYLNLPKINNYELSEIDHVFQISHASRFILQGDTVLTADFLRQAIMELEIKAGKKKVIPRNKEWLMTFVSREYPALLKMVNYEVFASVVYNYWKTRREALQFPLFRPLWRPSFNQYGHLLAFKMREKETKNLRRENRMVQEEISMDLYGQFDVALKVADRIELRQELKTKHLRQAINDFYFAVGNFDNLNNNQIICLDEDGDDELDDNIQSLQVRCRRLQAQMENYRQSIRSDDMQEQAIKSKGSLDQSMTMVNCLPTVVNEMASQAIDRHNLCTEQSLQKQGRCLLPSEASLPSSINSNENINGICLQNISNSLAHSFQAHRGQIPKVVIESYLDYKRQKVSRCYFGSDDQHEGMDLRKDIGKSFIKLMHSSIPQ